MSDLTAQTPRTRWAGVVWGLAFAALAAAGLWMLSAPERINETFEAALRLSPVGLVAVVLLILGALVLVTGLVGVLGRAQRAARRRRETIAPETSEQDEPAQQ